MARLKVYDLATGTWQYAGGVDPVALATDVAFTSRYPPKPSSGIVYGVDHYHSILGANVTITNVIQTLITQAMPIAPAGSLLDISWMVYNSTQIAGSGGTFYSVEVNAVTKGPTVVVQDAVSLQSFAGRVVGVVPPVGITYNVTLRGVKAAAGGTVVAIVTHTVLSIVSYRP